MSNEFDDLDDDALSDYGESVDSTEAVDGEWSSAEESWDDAEVEEVLAEDYGLDESDADLDAALSGAEPDESDAPKGFLSTTAGKAAAGGVAAAVVLGVLSAGSMFVGGGGQPAPQPQQPMAQADPWGQMNQPAPTYNEPAPQAVPEPEPVLAPETVRAPSAADRAAAMVNQSQNAPAEVATALPSPPEPLASSGPEEAEPEQVTVNEEQVIALIQPLLSENLDAGLAEIQEKTDRAVTESLKRLEQRTEAAIAELREELNAIRKDLQAGAEELAEETKEAFLEGRERLKGFQVINATEDGSMSVVKTPTGNVNVYFKGEKFRALGRTQTVSGIEEKGAVVLVGDKHFIDGELEALPKPAPKRAAPQAKASKNQAPANPKVAEGWRVGGSTGQGYLLRHPNGEFSLVKAGDRVEGLGVVGSTDDRGNLRVGDSIVLRGP